MTRTHVRGGLGLALVAVGLSIVGLTVRDQVDPVFLTFSRSHGLHVTDFVGSAVCFVGVWLVWTRR